MGTDAALRNGPDSRQSDELAAIADLLVDLPTAERQAAIADLPVNERAQVARLLIARRAGRGAPSEAADPEGE